MLYKTISTSGRNEGGLECPEGPRISPIRAALGRVCRGAAVGSRQAEGAAPKAAFWGCRASFKWDTMAKTMTMKKDTDKKRRRNSNNM